MQPAWMLKAASELGGSNPNSQYLRQVSSKSTNSNPDTLSECIATGSQAVCDLFEYICDDEGAIKKSEFLSRISDSGLRLSDPRLENAMKELLPKQIISLSRGNDSSFLIDTSGALDMDSFRKIVVHNLDLIGRAIKRDFVIPDFKEFTNRIEAIANACKGNCDGNRASYIPQLARVNPEFWGVSVCTVDGQRYSYGNVDVPFCIQSCSKPLAYALALQELGPDVVHRYVGQEPSGQHFNAVSLDHNSRPHNPMVNSGAIVISSLLKPGLPLSERFDYLSKFLKRMSGGASIGFNNSIFLSERESADRNFALAYYMREHHCFPQGTNLMETLDFYFQQCSVEINCDAASVIAATLANGGVCPITSETILDPHCVCHTLSLMLSCGMYDYSGQFAFKIGVPAKSGVSGAVLLVIPNLAGFCVYSPRLDPLGNSCRGIQFCEMLLKEFNFHMLDSMRRMKYKRDPRQRRFDQPVNSVLNLIYSAAVGDIMSVTRHAMNNCDMNGADYDGRTALHLAATEGHIDIVKYLLNKCRVSVLPRDRWGNTPLDDAVRCEHSDIEKLLAKTASAVNASALPGHSVDEKIKEVCKADASINSSSAVTNPIKPVSADFSTIEAVKTGESVRREDDTVLNAPPVESPAETPRGDALVSLSPTTTTGLSPRPKPTRPPPPSRTTSNNDAQKSNFPLQ